MTSHSHIRTGQRGFTLVELIVVLVIVGILATIASARYFERNSFDAGTFSDVTKSLLRYGQKVAIAQNRAVYVRLDGSSVALCFTPACAESDRVPAPSGANSGSTQTLSACGASPTWFCEAVPTGIAYSLAPAPAFATPPKVFYFDQKGKPYLAADPETSDTSTFAFLDISISGDGNTRTISVERETGYVY